MGITLNFDLVPLFSAKPAGLCLLLFSSLFAAYSKLWCKGCYISAMKPACVHMHTRTHSTLNTVQMSDIVLRKLKVGDVKFKN